MAEYIQNGDFKNGDLDPWVSKGSVESEEDINRQRYHVSIGAASQILQHWRMDEPHGSLLFTVDIKVENGSDLPRGGVQVLFLFSGGPGDPISATYNVKEASEWETLYLPLNAGGNATSGNIDLLVQPGFTNKVTMTNISLLGVTGEQYGFELVKYEVGKRDA